MVIYNERMSLYYICGLVGCVTLVVALLVMVLLRPLSVHQTFSRHAAQSRALSIFYFLLFVIAMPLLWIFTHFYLMPLVGAPMLSYLFAGVAVFQIFCTMFPESGDRVHTHRLFAGISAGLMIPFMAILATATSSFICWVALGTMLTTVIVAFVTRGRYALILQAVYYLGFFSGMFYDFVHLVSAT